MNSSNTLVSFLFRFRMAPDTMSMSYLQSPRVRRGCCSWSSNEAAHVTGSPCSMVVPSPSTWSWLVTFMILTGNLGRARNNILAMYSPSRKVSWLSSTRTFAAPRGASNRSITTLSHRAGITSSLSRESRDVGRAPGFHGLISSCPMRSRWRPKSTDAS
jgi:hypothetical protein